MYRSRFWTMRQYAGFATAAETNERFRYLLGQGQTGLSVAFDLPTQMGYDSDAPEAEGEVGRVGVPISSLADMEALFAGIPLGEVSTSMTINATAPILLALYVAAAERQGVDRAAVSGHHPERHPQGVHRPRDLDLPAPGVDAPRDRRVRVRRPRAPQVEHDQHLRLPHARGRGHGGPGARVHARRRHRLRRGGRRPGPRVDDFAPRLSFFFAAWSELFEEVAKFRAARRMWARIMQDRFGASNARSMMCRFHTQTAGSSLTAQSIDNNVVRTTLQALAAVLGGTQSLHTNSRDEALALPTAEAARLALRTQQIIAHEAGVTETPDPLAGLAGSSSRLTDELEAAANGLPRGDRRHGRHARRDRGRASSSARSRSRPTGSSARSSARTGSSSGVNRFRDDGEAVTAGRSSGSTRKGSGARSRASGGSGPSATRRPGRPPCAASRTRPGATANLLPPIIEAVAAYATVGEISDRLRAVWGVHRELITV